MLSFQYMCNDVILQTPVDNLPLSLQTCYLINTHDSKIYNQICHSIFLRYLPYICIV